MLLTRAAPASVWLALLMWVSAVFWGTDSPFVPEFGRSSAWSGILSGNFNLSFGVLARLFVFVVLFVFYSAVKNRGRRLKRCSSSWLRRLPAALLLSPPPLSLVLRPRGMSIGCISDLSRVRSLLAFFCPRSSLRQPQESQLENKSSSSASALAGSDSCSTPAGVSSTASVLNEDPVGPYIMQLRKASQARLSTEACRARDQRRDRTNAQP